MSQEPRDVRPQEEKTAILQEALASLMVSRTGQQNWPEVQRLARSIPDPGSGSAIHAWKRKHQDTGEIAGAGQGPLDAIGELETAIREDLGERGRLQEVLGRYIIDAATGEIIRKRTPGEMAPLRGKPRPWGRQGTWAVWLSGGQGRTAQPGDTVEVEMKQGPTRTVTVDSIINTLPNGAQNVRVNW